MCIRDRSEDVFNPRMVLYRSKKPVMIIPNLAIHMNRDVNKGVGIKMCIRDSFPAAFGGIRTVYQRNNR